MLSIFNALLTGCGDSAAILQLSCMCRILIYNSFSMRFTRKRYLDIKRLYLCKYLLIPFYFYLFISFIKFPKNATQTVVSSITCSSRIHLSFASLISLKLVHKIHQCNGKKNTVTTRMKYIGSKCLISTCQQQILALWCAEQYPLPLDCS